MLAEQRDFPAKPVPTVPCKPLFEIPMDIGLNSANQSATDIRMWPKESVGSSREHTNATHSAGIPRPHIGAHVNSEEFRE